MNLVAYLLGFYMGWGVFQMPVPVATLFGLLFALTCYLRERVDEPCTGPGDSNG